MKSSFLTFRAKGLRQGLSLYEADDITVLINKERTSLTNDHKVVLQNFIQADISL